MKCRDIEDLLFLYSGGDLSRWKQFIVRNHLQNCENCRLELGKLQRTRDIVTDALRQEETANVDSQLWERVLYRLPKGSTDKDRGTRTERTIPSVLHRLAPALAGIAIFLIIVLIRFIPPLHKQNRGPSMPSSSHIPVVESVNKSGITVMTFKTDDPKVTIVWFFEEESKS